MNIHITIEKPVSEQVEEELVDAAHQAVKDADRALEAVRNLLDPSSRLRCLQYDNAMWHLREAMIELHTSEVYEPEVFHNPKPTLGLSLPDNAVAKLMAAADADLPF